MHKFAQVWCLSLLVMLAVLFAAPQTAHAADPGNGSSALSPDMMTVCPDKGPNGQLLYTARVVGCIKATIFDASEEISSEMYKAMKKPIMATITLSIVIFGIMVMLGAVEMRMSAHGMLYVLKVAFVLFASMSFPAILNIVLQLMDGMMDALGKVFLVNGICPTTMQVDEAGTMVNMSSPSMWQAVDCAINRIVGIAPGVMLKAGVVGMIVAFLFSPDMGIFILTLGILFITTSLFTVLRSVYIFLTAYMALVFMGMVAPIIVPMLLFQRTRPMFDKWVKGLTDNALQPIFLFVYLGFVMLVMDTMVFHSQYSLFHTIAGPAADQRDFSLGKWFNDNKLYTNRFNLNWLIDIIPGDWENKVDNNGPLGVALKVTDYINPVINKLKRDKFSSVDDALETLVALNNGPASVKNAPEVVAAVNLINEIIAGTRALDDPQISAVMKAARDKSVAEKKASDRLKDLTQIKIRIPVTVIDIDKWAAIHVPSTNREDLVWQLISSLMSCLAMAYMLYTMLKYIPELATELTGGTFSPNLAQGSMPLENKISGAISGGLSAMHQAADGQKGLLTGGGLGGIGAFASGVVHAPMGAIRGFISG